MWAHKSLLVEDQSILAAQQRAIIDADTADLRDPAQLERTLALKSAEISGDRAQQARAEKDVQEFLTLVDELQKARESLAQAGESFRELEKVDRRLSTLRDRLAEVRDTAAKASRIASARQSVLDAWLSEVGRNGKSNRSVIEAARKKDRALAAI
jgi:hypothetical protein